jgi:hypothetical protein
VIPPFTAVGRALFVKRLVPAELAIARFSRRSGKLVRNPSEMGVISPSEGVHPYPLSSVVLGAVLPPGHKSRSPWPLSALLRQPEALRLLWRIVLRRRRPKILTNHALAVLRFHRPAQ